VYVPLDTKIVDSPHHHHFGTLFHHLHSGIFFLNGFWLDATLPNVFKTKQKTDLNKEKQTTGFLLTC
jgi:hypothetical protein